MCWVVGKRTFPPLEWAADDLTTECFYLRVWIDSNLGHDAFLFSFFAVEITMIPFEDNYGLLDDASTSHFQFVAD